jgi:hypothetical protein
MEIYGTWFRWWKVGLNYPAVDGMIGLLFATCAAQRCLGLDTSAQTWTRCLEASRAQLSHIGDGQTIDLLMIVGNETKVVSQQAKSRLVGKHNPNPTWAYCRYITYFYI